MDGGFILIAILGAFGIFALLVMVSDEATRRWEDEE